MERVRGGLEGIPYTLTNTRLTRGVNVGIHLVRMIQFLHDIGIIHNDIHSGNVALDLVHDKLLLIDFGRSLMMDPTARELPTRIVNEFGEAWNDALNSPWEIEGYSQSSRDDLYRAIEVIGHIIIGSSLIQTMRMSQRDSHVLHSWKMKENFFQFIPWDTLKVPLQPSLIREANWKRRKARKIVLEFGKMLTLVRSILHGNKITVFDDILLILITLKHYIASDEV